MKGVALFVAMLLAASSGSHAKSSPPVSQQGVALVLAGGGAKGLAHIGFLRALEERNIRISAIAGTSMGALMAGLYACGYSALQLDQLVSDTDWGHLFSSLPEPWLTFLPDRIRGRQDLISLNLRGLTPVLPSSAVSNMRVGFLLSGMTGPVQVFKGLSFDSLRIPLRIVASDLVSQRRIVFRSGLLYIKQLASMAIPGVFPPVMRDSMLLVDGGMFDNMPVDAIVKDWPELPVLAVNVGSADPMEYPDSPSLLSVAGMTFTALSDIVNREHYHEPDWLFQPDLYGSNVWSFDRADSLIRWGYVQGLAWLDENPGLPTGGPDRSRGWTPPPLVLRNVLFSGNERVSVLAIDRWLTLSPGDTLTVKTMTTAAENLYASGLFSMIRFTMLSCSSPGIADLAFELTEKDPGSVGLGLSFNNDFGLDSRVTVEHTNTFNRGIRSIFNFGGGNGYAFAELSSLANTQDRNRYFGVNISISQIKGLEGDADGVSFQRIWTEHRTGLSAGRPFSWFGMAEFSAGLTGRSYAHTGITQSYPHLTASFLTDTRENPAMSAPGTRFYLQAGWSPAPRSRHSWLEWDVNRTTVIAGKVRGGLFTWGKLMWGDNYPWQESRLTASRGIPGYRWNCLPSRERIAGGFTLSRETLGPVFIEIEATGTYDFDSFDRFRDGGFRWGAGVEAGVNIPGGTARLGPGVTDTGSIRWSFSYGSDYSFGPGR